MAHDLTQLRRLAARRERIEAELPKLRAEIEAEVRAQHAAGAPQVELVQAAKVTREIIRVACLPDDQREAWKTRRRRPDATS